MDKSSVPPRVSEPVKIPVLQVLGELVSKYNQMDADLKLTRIRLTNVVSELKHATNRISRMENELKSKQNLEDRITLLEQQTNQYLQKTLMDEREKLEASAVLFLTEKTQEIKRLQQEMEQQRTDKYLQIQKLEHELELRQIRHLKLF